MSNEHLADLFRVRQVYLFRHQASVRAEIEKLIDALAGELVGSIARISPSEPARRAYRANRVSLLIDRAYELVSEAYKGIRSYHEGDLKQLAEAEALWIVQSVNGILGREQVRIGRNLEAVAETVRDSLLAGAPVREWWEEQSRDVQKTFAREMRIGLVGGETDADLIKRVRQYVPVSKRRAKILVRGASSAVTSQVRKKAVLDNPRVFRGIQQVSVFDGRTSDICISYAGKVWSLPDFDPVGHSLPYNGGVPRHPNCRSTEISVLTDEYGGAPADDISFDDFLKGKSPSFVANLLGKGKAKLYLDGRISLSDLVDQSGRALTLDEISAELTKE